MLFLGYLVVVLTVLSISAIATSATVGGGGVYCILKYLNGVTIIMYMGDTRSVVTVYSNVWEMSGQFKLTGHRYQACNTKMQILSLYSNVHVRYHTRYVF